MRRFRTLFSFLLIFSTALFVTACGEPEADENHDHEDLDVHGVELLDLENDNTVLAESHDDHWDGAPLTFEPGEEIIIGFRFLGHDDEELDIDLASEDFELDTSVHDEEVLSVELHGDHVDVEALEDGNTQLHLSLLHDDEVLFEAPELEVSVAVTEE